MNKEELAKFGESLDLDHTTRAYCLGGKATHWTNYSKPEGGWDEDAYYKDFGDWWKSLPIEKQEEIYNSITEKDNEVKRVIKLISLTSEQKFWLKMMEHAYGKFLENGGELFKSFEIESEFGEVFAINTRNLAGRYDSRNHTNLLDSAEGFYSTSLRIPEYLDEFNVSLKS